MSGERWTFGVQPLEQTREAAQLLRLVTSQMLALEGDEPALAGLIDELRRTTEALAERVPPDGRPRIGPFVHGDGRVYLDHGGDIGSFNPCFPRYDLTVDGPHHAHGTVEFPIAYEGPPGLVHGGFLAVFFDCVVQDHNCAVMQAGKTRALQLRYRRPTPLLTSLTFEIDRSVTDRTITSTSRLMAEGRVVLCEAQVDAVAGDFVDLPAITERRVL